MAIYTHNHMIQKHEKDYMLFVKHLSITRILQTFAGFLIWKLAHLLTIAKIKLYFLLFLIFGNIYLSYIIYSIYWIFTSWHIKHLIEIITEKWF